MKPLPFFLFAMEAALTVEELEKRWKHVLTLTRDAVNKNPGPYLELKSLANDVVEQPLDIKEYIPTAQKLSDILKSMDPDGRGSIFYLFSDRFSPAGIWQVPLFRMECKDLLAHLHAFDLWRRKTQSIRVIK